MVMMEPDAWAKYSRDAHLIVFTENRHPEMDRIDFTIILEHGGLPHSFATIRELDAESAYYQHGGLFPPALGKGDAHEYFRATTDIILSKYRRVNCLIQNTNVKMQKVALGGGFLPIGIRNFKGDVFVEYAKERE